VSCFSVTVGNQKQACFEATALECKHWMSTIPRWRRNGVFCVWAGRHCYQDF